MNSYLCFDAGTQSVKVGVYTLDGECLAKAVNSTHLFYPNPGRVEMNINEYYELAVKGIAECVKIMRENNHDLNSIRAIMGDGIICGIAGIDESGEPVTPYINYLDSRTQEDAVNLANKNLDIWARETGNPEPLCLFPAMHARWLLKNKNKKIFKFIHNAPYILMKLAGLETKDAFIDHGAMSGWGLGYDVINKKWSDEQLEILNINKNLMPKIIRPWDVIGKISQKISDLTGLPAGISILAGAGDTMQSLIACGVFEAGHAVDVAGTCSMFCISTNGIVPGLSKKGNNLIFNSGTLPDTYFYWGFVRTGGLALRWFRDNICGRPDDDLCYKNLSAGAAKIPAGANGVRFLPWLTGGPAGFENIRGCFLNMGMDTDQFILWRAVLEAIAGEYSEIADRCRKSGTPVNKIIITEGGSRDALWNQIKADMIRAETITLETGGALASNAIIGALGAGDLNIDNMKNILNKNLKETGHFIPCSDEFYNKNYKFPAFNLNIG